MNEDRQSLVHLHSNEIINGEGKIPTSGSVEYGEIAIGYADGHETIFIRNDSDEIISFSCDDKFNESFRVMSKAMCDLDDRVLALEEISALTVGDLIETTTEIENVSSSGKVVDAIIIKGINNRLTGAETSAGTLNSAVNTLEASATSANTRITTLESSASSVNNRLDTLESSASSVNTRLDNLDSSATSANTRITTLESSATSVNTRLDGLETSAGTFNTRISDLEASAITVNDVIYDENTFKNVSTSGKVVDAMVIKDAINEILPMKEITWSDLKTLRDSSGLTPGMQYRITDYNTTTAQEDTQAAGHQFDIIVVADDVNKLNENARACLHSGDTYFSTSGANLNAWEIKYCLDNDTTRFYWAVTGSTGRGVIYYMKDEWNNECPYDFKNIQFKRKLTDGEYDTGGVETFVYTFNAYDLDNETINDASIMVGRDALDDGTQYCFSNVIKPLFRIYAGNTDGFFMLNDNVFLNSFSLNDGTYFECFYNTFGNNCQLNTFGSDCNSNTFGSDCNSNTFGNSCTNNSFGYGCGLNTFGYGCGLNTFGYGCNSNTFGNNFQSNTFGNGCNSNTFGNNCQSNTFGGHCFSNTFGYNCDYNTFGNYCFSNTFGNSCTNNTFGNNCQRIIFNKDYVHNVIVENGNKYIDITSTQTTSGSNILRNFTIAQGVNNTSTVKTISHNTLNDTFKTTYQPANSQVISI